MMQYLAVIGNSGIFLSNSSQIDEFLMKGYDIYEVYEDDSRKLVYSGGKKVAEGITDE